MAVLARGVYPSFLSQQRKTQRLLSRPLLKNELWYLISTKWFQTFKDYIQLGKKWNSSAISKHPGPIDNHSLYLDDECTEISNNLVEDVDYELVPEELWVNLKSWYGMVPDQTPIARKVVDGKNIAPDKIEVYPITLGLMKGQDAKTVYFYTFSKKSTIRNVAEVCRKMFDIPEEVKLIISVWCNSSLVLDFDKSIQEIRLPDEKVLVAETLLPAMLIKEKQETRIPVHQYSEEKIVTPGCCGLRNLGNTCYMNSVIQCLSNCPPLARHFADNLYLNDLNLDNPIGMKGRIASAFGNLIKIIWSGNHKFTVPRDFREQVGVFAPQFKSNEQQDAHEFMTFLLDGLHEDINRVKIKPYIERKDSNGRPDEVIASEAWKAHKKRDDSVIVDYFHGLLKSTVICPRCTKTSVTFDPFYDLSLPLPATTKKKIEVLYFPCGNWEVPQRMSIMIPKEGRIFDMLLLVSEHSGSFHGHLIVAEIKKQHFHKFFDRNDHIDSIFGIQNLAVYEIQNLSLLSPVPVVLWEVDKQKDFNVSQLFGFPLMIMLNLEQSTYQDIYRAILSKLLDFMALPKADCCFCRKEGSYSSACKCQHVTSKYAASVLPEGLFTLHLVNTSSSSIAFKLHDDGRPLNLPGKEKKGRQYLAAQWTAENRRLFLSQEKFDNLLQGHIFECPTRSYDSCVQLEECLRLYTMHEQLSASDAWFCPSCEMHQQAFKKIDLWQLPKILIIHLKRFSKLCYGSKKLNFLVEFPIENLDMSKYVTNDKHPPARYKLIGVCNHFGLIGSGHYNTFALNREDKCWYTFDDHIVTPRYKDSIVTNSAYVLFYLRSDVKM